jgi:hypothetical protein
MEMLEKRLMQAVDWFTLPAVDGGVQLWITAIDDPLHRFSDETILIADDGTSGTNNVVMKVNGAYRRVGRVSEIHVRTGAGQDTVQYGLIGNLRGGRVIDVEMGGGGDRFTANLYNGATGAGSDLLEGSTFNLRVRGGEGTDEIRVNADRDVDIQAAARLYATLGGDDQQDAIDFLYRGELDGTLELVASGDAGNDAVRAWLILDQGSTGTVGNPLRPVRVRGGIQDDALTLLVQDNGHAIVFAQIMGDGGRDDFTFTSNVAVVW